MSGLEMIGLAAGVSLLEGAYKLSKFVYSLSVKYSELRDTLDRLRDELQQVVNSCGLVDEIIAKLSPDQCTHVAQLQERSLQTIYQIHMILSEIEQTTQTHFRKPRAFKRYLQESDQLTTLRHQLITDQKAIDSHLLRLTNITGMHSLDSLQYLIRQDKKSQAQLRTLYMQNEELRKSVKSLHHYPDTQNENPRKSVKTLHYHPDTHTRHSFQCPNPLAIEDAMMNALYTQTANWHQLLASGNGHVIPQANPNFRKHVHVQITFPARQL
ncbi:hypothetical protein F4808DRAFT_402138 [Astrocystis sublimbata]|nr:hypothetical protein F4808DRAFT_402138 [Astrocystis sublimbata]